MDINIGFIEDSNIEESVTNIDVRVESEAKSSDSQHGQLGLSLTFPPRQFPVHSYVLYAIDERG